MEVRLLYLKVLLVPAICGVWLFKEGAHGQQSRRIHGACRTLEFSPPIDGHALMHHVIKNITLGRQDSCRVACYLEKDCLSYNFPHVEDGKHICQLSDSDHVQHPEDLQKREDFVYRGTENACSRNPCSQSNGECGTAARHNCEKEWRKINTAPVCFGARDDTYVSFKITENGLILTFKLVHRIGTLSCWSGSPGSYWACINRWNHGSSKLSTVITHPNKTALELAPYAGRILERDTSEVKCRYYMYYLHGVSFNSTELTFNKLSPLPVSVGQEFQIWFGQDLMDCSEYNNSGQTCVDVFALCD